MIANIPAGATPTKIEPAILKPVQEELYVLNRTLLILGRAQAERLTCRRAKRRRREETSEQSRYSHESNNPPPHHVSSLAWVREPKAPEKPTRGSDRVVPPKKTTACNFGVTGRRRVRQQSHRALNLEALRPERYPDGYDEEPRT
jgi:hypothetical protein